MAQVVCYLKCFPLADTVCSVATVLILLVWKIINPISHNFVISVKLIILQTCKKQLGKSPLQHAKFMVTEHRIEYRKEF